MTKQLNVVLGGAGLIGSALHRTLESRGEPTIIYDLKTGVNLRQHEPDEVPGDVYYWFLAWDVGGAKYLMDKSQQLSILRHNLGLCEKIFGWLERRKAGFTFVSSQMAGFPNAYGITKSVGELWAESIGNGLITRLWNCYDAEAPSVRSHVVPDLVRQAKTGTIKLLTLGEERRQFLHVDDVAEALIEQRDLGQPLADVTSGTWVPIREIAELIGKRLNANVAVGSSPGYESLVEPAHLLEGWSPRVDLATGIAMVIERMTENHWL
ncbi:MAG: NAD-dependent epimerase/dehydratase family protein [Acidiferrobacterales bacterium]